MFGDEGVTVERVGCASGPCASGGRGGKPGRGDGPCGVGAGDRLGRRGQFHDACGGVGRSVGRVTITSKSTLAPNGDFAKASSTSSHRASLILILVLHLVVEIGRCLVEQQERFTVIGP